MNLVQKLLPTRTDIDIIALYSCHSPGSVYVSHIHFSWLSQMLTEWPAESVCLLTGITHRQTASTPFQSAIAYKL